jgi:sporulation protein YlmC with PRC-barrel domain
MRLKDLRGLPVIDPTAARKVGTVSDYHVDPASGRLAALDVTRQEGGEGERILAQRIRRVGGSAVMLTMRGGSMPGATVEVNERWLDTSTLVGLEVMGDDGTRVGRLADATFDQDTLAIEAYLLQGSSLLDSFGGRRTRIEPEKVHSCSRELMLISSGVAETGETAGTPEPEATTAEDTTPIETPVTLKNADKLPAPTHETVPDGQPVSTSHG